MQCFELDIPTRFR